MAALLASEAIDMTPQQLQQVREILTSLGAPLTAENYNRASLALVTGRGFTPDMTQEEAPRSIQSRGRSQGNRAAAAAPSQQELPMPPPATPMDDSGPRARMTDGFMKGSNEEPNSIMNNIMAQIEAVNANMPRRGSMPRAQVIDEENPEAGMFAGAPPRQADETGVDAMGLATALGAPFMALAPAGGLGAAMAGARGPLPAAVQAERAARMQQGQAAAALRDRAIRGINRDRAAAGDPRGRISETRTGRRMASE